MQKRTDGSSRTCHDAHTPRKDPTAKKMLFALGLVVAVIAVVVLRRLRVSGGVDAAPLGWMSEHWLAEYRASHSA